MYARGQVDAALALVQRMGKDGVGLRSEQLALIIEAAARSGRLRDAACRAAIHALISATAVELVGMEVNDMRRVAAAVGGQQVRDRKGERERRERERRVIDETSPWPLSLSLYHVRH